MDIEAAILVEQKKPLEIETIKLNEKLKVGQVLVKLKTSGICGTQLGEIDGVKGKDAYLPHLLGHEGCGLVIDTGPGVKNVKEGDKVVLHWKKGDGINAELPSYQLSGKKINAGWVTTFNSHAVISENRCTPIPLHISDDAAALFGCAITTGFGVVENNAQLKMGESIVIFGAGGIGLNIIQASKLSSAWPIIAVDLHQNRLDLSKKLGATHLINSNLENAYSKIKEITNDNELDVFIDNTGIPSIIEMGYKLVRTSGRVILVGVPKLNENINIYSLPLHFGLQLKGSFGGEINPSQDIPRYIKMLENKIWDFKELITERHKLKDINTAISSMRKGLTAGRVIIEL